MSLDRALESFSFFSLTFPAVHEVLIGVTGGSSFSELSRRYLPKPSFLSSLIVTQDNFPCFAIFQNIYGRFRASASSKLSFLGYWKINQLLWLFLLFPRLLPLLCCILSRDRTKILFIRGRTKLESQCIYFIIKSWLFIAIINKTD